MDEFIEKVRQNYGESKLIFDAYAYACKAHKGEKRKSGEDYIVHPVAVACILMDLGMDEATIAASLLHDVVEDTPATFKDIKNKFGPEVEKLVKSVSKINRIKYTKKEILEMDSLKRLFIAMSKDFRVILIKLADRLHNIRTVEYLPNDKRIKFCSETMNLFVPLAERLGFSQIRNEYEDICFKYLYPEEYEKITQELHRKFDKSSHKMEVIKQVLTSALEKENITANVSCRFKHIFSLYKKIKSKGTEKIYDAIGARVIVHTVQECYNVLYVVHSNFKPIPGRIKDYIARPKPNGYQSIHTTVLMKDGTPFEVQIRTQEMHLFSEEGIASHWRYKTGENKKEALEEKLNAFKEVVEQDKFFRDSEDFINALKLDLSTAEIWVFTPKHKPISLPEHSTPVDFAYAIHSDVGNTCVGAKVNGKKVKLNTTLETGDVVEILTDKQKVPSRDWLRFAKSAHARMQIRNYFKKSINAESVKNGRQMLEEISGKSGISIGDLLSGPVFEEVKRKYLVYSLDDMFSSISAGGINAQDIISIAKQIDKHKNIVEKEESEIYIEGSEINGVKLAHCCTPIPGDKIVAIESSSGAITVHHEKCKNIKYIEKDRLLDACWKEDLPESKTYDLSLRIGGKDEYQMLGKIINILYDEQTRMTTITAKSISKSKFEIVMNIKVKNAEEANKLIEKFQTFENVQYVNRINLLEK